MYDFERDESVRRRYEEDLRRKMREQALELERTLIYGSMREYYERDGVIETEGQVREERRDGDAGGERAMLDVGGVDGDRRGEGAAGRD